MSILYPRLELLRQLLSEQGTIYVHIDDNELGYLIPIMDEIFGRPNQVCIATFKQGSATGHKSINPDMVSTTNFILAYCANKKLWAPNKVFTPRERDSRYGQYIQNFDDEYTYWKLRPLSEAFAATHSINSRELKKKLCNQYENKINEFVVTNAHRVVQPVRPDYSNVGEDVRVVIDKSKNNPDKVMLLKRDDYSDMYFKGGQRWIFYKNKLKDIDGQIVAGEPLTTLWADLLSNNLHKEGGVKFPKSKKPESLVKRVLELSSNPGDLILGSFLGSGMTAAVAHKMGRRYIGIEMGEHAISLCQPRLINVTDGEQEGVSKAADWQGGGGFHFYQLGPAIFDEYGVIRPDITFEELAAHIWYMETRRPLTKKPVTPLLGVHEGKAYYLLYNGILGDRKPQGGNVLTSKVLTLLSEHEGEKVIYGEVSRLGEARLNAEKIQFKQMPYDVGTH